MTIDDNFAPRAPLSLLGDSFLGDPGGLTMEESLEPRAPLILDVGVMMPDVLVGDLLLLFPFFPFPLPLGELGDFLLLVGEGGVIGLSSSRLHIAQLSLGNFMSV